MELEVSSPLGELGAALISFILFIMRMEKMKRSSGKERMRWLKVSSPLGAASIGFIHVGDGGDEGAALVAGGVWDWPWVRYW